MSHQSAPAGGRRSPSAGSPMNTTPRRRARLRRREGLSNVPVKATAADGSSSQRYPRGAAIREAETVEHDRSTVPRLAARLAGASPVRYFGGRSVLVFRAAVARRPLRVLAMVGRNSFFRISSYDELLVFSRTTRVAVRSSAMLINAARA